MLKARLEDLAEFEEMPRERKPLPRRIVEDARGWIDAVVIIVSGARIALMKSGEVGANDVADAARVIADAAVAVMELFGSRRFRELDLRILGGRHLVIRCHRSCYIAALTKPNPNLGLVKLALDKNLPPEKSAGEAVITAEKASTRAHVR